MKKISTGLTFVLATALAIPLLAWIPSVQAKTAAKSSDDSADGASSSEKGLSREDQAKLREHMKLRSEINKVKYPASKADVVAHVKGIKPDDKKWFEQTLPDRDYESANEVMSALGWETVAASDKPAAKQPGKAAGAKGAKPQK
jgi:hypothetical protein